jgi:hypothetical protein
LLKHTFHWLSGEKVVLDSLDITIQALDLVYDPGHFFKDQWSRELGISQLQPREIVATTSADIHQKRSATVAQGSVNQSILDREPFSPVTEMSSSPFHEGIEPGQGQRILT